MIKYSNDSIQTQLMKNSETNGSESIEKDDLRDCATNFLVKTVARNDTSDSDEDK